MKKCQFCGAELPDESSFCLSCSSVLNERKVISSGKDKKKKFLFFYYKPSGLFKALFVVLIGLSFCFLSISAMKNRIDKSSEPETILIPVTDEKGENVTDINNEPIYEVVEVSVSSTENKNLLNKLFGKNDDNTKGSETTTKKPSLLDKIFKDDKTTEVSSTAKPTSPANEPSSAEKSTDKHENPATSSDSKTEPTNETAPNEEVSKEDTANNISNFTYTEQNGKIKITKYTGSASTVTVPAYIDGKRVAYLGEKAFADNSGINKIVFQGSALMDSRFYLPYDTVVFYNLPNLTSVTFPYETNNYMITDGGETSRSFSFHKLFTQCKKLREVNFSERKTSDKYIYVMSSVDGVVLTQTDSNIRRELIYYPVGKTSESFTVPEDTYSIEKYAFYCNTYIKSLTITKGIRSVNMPQFIGCANLQSYNVTADNPMFFSENGVMYGTGIKINDVQYASVYYPPGKTDTTFEFTSKVNLAFDNYTFCGNPYIQTAKCRSALWIQDKIIASGYGPKALKTVYVNKEKKSENRIWSNEFTIIYY